MVIDPSVVKIFGVDDDDVDWAAYGREAFLQNWRKRAERAEAEAERLSGNLSELLWQLTSGKMSKPTYAVKTMLLAIEEEFENQKAEADG